MKSWQRELRIIVDMYEDIQAERIALANRLRQGEFSGEFEEFAIKRIEGLRKDEEKLRRSMEKILEESLIWQQWLKYVKGIGSTLASKILSKVDFDKAKSPSSLWSFFGLAVKDGKAIRRRRGEKTRYPPEMKKLYYNIGTSIEKSKGKYRKLYDAFKEREESRKVFEISLAKLKADPESYYGSILLDYSRKLLKVKLSQLKKDWERYKANTYYDCIIHSGDFRGIRCTDEVFMKLVEQAAEKPKVEIRMEDFQGYQSQT